jgi:predicted kinase
MKSLLVLISGFSGTGKTTLAKKIAERYSLPLISKDDIKESLYDSLGYSDREWSKQLGVASYNLLYLFTENLLATEHSVIIESNFKFGIDTVKLLNLKHKYQFSLLQIHCYVEIAIALQRFKNRSRSLERHPGHVDHLIYEEMESNFKKGGYEILNICDREAYPKGNHTIKIETSDFDSIDYQAIYQTIENYHTAIN